VEALEAWLERRSSADGRLWLAQQTEAVRTAVADRALYTAFGMVPNKLGKADLALDETELRRANECRPGWDPRAWTVDQAARVLLVLASGTDDGSFAARLERLFRTADVGEAVALYRGLPLYPDQPSYVARASEGARTNIRSTFEAVAHENPYPVEFFSESAWNQMVVKALFIGSTLAPIQGLATRDNPELALMLRGYAHERWAAGRTVSYEVWRCVGRCGGIDALADLDRVFASGSVLERRAAALALHANRTPEAAAVLQTDPDLARAVADGSLSWTTITGIPTLLEASPL
jgi:hypothetical protein